MSKPVRVAFVMEGPTDYVVLRAAVRALLDGRDFEPTVIWPELDESFAAQTAGGWGGVYRWCRQAVEQVGGPARSNPVFEFHDVLVIQVDADVARRKYSDYKITDAPTTICLARRVVRLRARRQTLYGPSSWGGWTRVLCHQVLSSARLQRALRHGSS